MSVSTVDRGFAANDYNDLRIRVQGFLISDGGSSCAFGFSSRDDAPVSPGDVIEGRMRPRL